MRPAIVVVLCFFASLLGGALGASLVAHPEWFGLSSAPEAEAAERDRSGDAARREAEEARRRVEREARRAEDLGRDEMKRRQDEARRKAEEEQRRDEARRAEEERRRADEEARRKVEEEARRRAEEARRRGEPEPRRQDDDAKRREEQRRAEEEEARRRDQEEARRREEEAVRRRDDERKRREDQKRSEEQRRADEERRPKPTGVTCESAVAELKGAFADGRDCFLVQRMFGFVLETSRIGAEPGTWSSPRSGSRGTMRILANESRGDGVMCRRFEQTVTANGVTRSGTGVACYRNNRWTIES
jgi:hypothetical protein